MYHNDRTVLGIHTGHDRGASLIKDGRLIFHAPEDRLDRVKHSESQELPALAIRKALKYTNTKPHQLDGVTLSCVNRESDIVEHYYLSSIEEVIGGKIANFFLVPHHVCHALCCSLLCEKEDLFVYVYDGAGDVFLDGTMESETLFHLTDNSETVVHQRRQDYHETFTDKIQFNFAEFMYAKYRESQISLGKKYNQFTSRCGFGPFEDGKTMGLAPFGRALIDVSPFLPTSLDFDLRLKSMLAEIAELRDRKGMSCVEFDQFHQADFAATIQTYLEGALDCIFKIIAREFQVNTIGLCGGVALNCVANHRIAASGIFERVVPFPAAGDDGQSVGAALFAARRLGIKHNGFPCFTPYIGPAYTSEEITSILDSRALEYRLYGERDLAELVAHHITSGRVVGFLRGRSELGPRALGHRSILASATHPKMRDILNERVKFRELFRPYAPMVRAEDAERYFELADCSPHMLYACAVRSEFQDLLPAITHVDGTARIQTVESDAEPFLDLLLSAVGDRCGHPVIVNTSFNMAGEPIIETPEDAIRTFLRTQIDVLVMESFVVERSTD